MGRPVEMPPPAPELAEDVAARRARAVELRLRVALFPDTIGGAHRFPRWLHRGLADARARADAHDRLAALLALAEEAAPVITRVDGGGRYSASRWLERAAQQWNDERAHAAQKGGQNG
jgi:hypothetical protein